MTRTALLAGATGLIGGHLLQLLLASPAYDKVTVLVRRPLGQDHPKLNQQVVDFRRLDPEDFGSDDLFCCLGTTIKRAGSQQAFREVDLEYPLAMARLGKAAGLKRYLVVSSIGADPRSPFFYSRVKGELEAELQALALPALHIFQPSLLLGERQEQRMGEAVAAILAKPLAPLMGKYRPILGSDVAKAMYHAALHGSPGLHTYQSDEIAALARNEAAN